MSRQAFFWYEFTLVVGGSVITELVGRPWGLILGGALVVLGVVMFCLTVIRSRKTPEPLQPEASQTIRK
jgi:hypothetical protein